jgi:hypothetical protein
MKKILILHVAKTLRIQAAAGGLRRALRPAGWALLGLTLHGAALAQAPDRPLSNAGGGDTVSWAVSAQGADSVKQGSRLTLTLHGAVQDGWHVYALKQPPGGPTPLRVTLDASDVAMAAGAPAGSLPTKIHDPAFDLDTQFYAHAFTLTAPVRVGAHLAAGRQLIPVSVRFQTCNGLICQPPKTVHLSASINVRADG